jgi:hypothetical protein
MPLDIQAVFGPKKLFTDSQLEIINQMRGDFLLLATNVGRKTNKNPMQEKGLEHLKEALHCFERSLTTPTTLTPDLIADALFSVERRDKRVSRVWMSASTFCNLRKYCRDIFEPETHIELLRTGLQGLIWSTEVFISRNIPDLSLVLIPEKEEETFSKDTVPLEAQLYRY